MINVTQTGRQTAEKMQVRIDHLDQLLSLAGEVIITSANLQDLERKIKQAIGDREALTDGTLNVVKTSNEATQRISQDLHDLVMAIRLVEIDNTMRLFRRSIRDLARSLGRDINLVFEGSDTMIDKALAERLVDPLLHMLRNAVDHGIEPPLERQKLGKPVQGTITLSAVDQEESTVITVSDDGRGIDEEEVIAAAEKMGIQTGGASLVDLICRPGVTTATEVTSTSGRGVGLDLVRTITKEFDGSIQLINRPGEGCDISLTIPKLRAVNIVDALTLRAGKYLLALPIDQIVASMGINPAQVQTALDRGRYFNYQGRIVVLHDLSELLGDQPLTHENDTIPVVIVKGKTTEIALVVSEFLGPQKLVNMPLDGLMTHAPCIAGTCVFTGGRLGLTLDINLLVATVVSDSSGKEDLESASARAGCGLTADVAISTVRTKTPKPQADHGIAGQADRDRKVPDTGTDALDGDDYVAVLEEARNNLAELQDVLISLEATPEDTKLLNVTFRRLHAVKGNFTMLNADQAQELAHALETLLDYLRGERIQINVELMDLMLDCVSYFTSVVRVLPETPPAPPEDVAERLLGFANIKEETETLQTDELVGKTFALSPTVELQVLSALKRGENTFETLVKFESGRQPDFLTAYLILRRIGLYGNVFASIPKVGQIEKGHCGNLFKVLWSTGTDESGLEELTDRLATQYGVTEFQSLKTTVFMYHKATDQKL